MAVPQRQNPPNSQLGHEPQRYSASHLRHSLHRRRLRKMRSRRGKLESYSRSDMLGTIRFPWNKLHLVFDNLCGVHDPRLDPDPDGSKPGQEKHHPSPVDRLVSHRFLEREY